MEKATKEPMKIENPKTINDLKKRYPKYTKQEICSRIFSKVYLQAPQISDVVFDGPKAYKIKYRSCKSTDYSYATVDKATLDNDARLRHNAYFVNFYDGDNTILIWPIDSKKDFGDTKDIRPNNTELNNDRSTEEKAQYYFQTKDAIKLTFDISSDSIVINTTEDNTDSHSESLF